MGLFVYKCNICGCTDEQFRKVEDREKQEPCKVVVGVKIYDATSLVLRQEINEPCPGIMQFQPINKTNFTMHHLND